MNSGKHQNRRKRKLHVLGNIGGRHHQAYKDERKNKKWVPQCDTPLAADPRLYQLL